MLPGIQALFGFQLVAVFNARFAEVLNAREQRLHYLAIALVTTVGRVILESRAWALLVATTAVAFWPRSGSCCLPCTSTAETSATLTSGV